MDNVPKINIEKLIGLSNWCTWKGDILYTMCLLDYQSIINGEDAGDSKSVVKDGAVKFIIQTSISSEEKEYVSSCATAKEMWEKLISKYEPGTANDLGSFTNFHNYSKNKNDSILTHVRKLEIIYDDLNKELKKAKKMFLPLNVLIRQIIKTLPPEYSDFKKAVWEKVRLDDRTLACLVQKLLWHQKKIKKVKKENTVTVKQEIIPPESCEENSVAVKKELINIGSCDQNLPDNIIIKKEIIPDDEPILIEFVCELCSKSYDNKKNYRAHVRRIHKEKNLSCHICNKKFTFLHKLKRHQRSHSISKIFEVICSLCGKGLSRYDKLSQHMLRYHSENSSPRTKPHEFKPHAKTRIKLEKMSEEELSKYSYKCEKCMFGYKRRGILINHMTKHHPDISLDSLPCLAVPIIETQKSYKCHYCQKAYMSQRKRKAHMIASHPKSVLPASSPKIDIKQVGILKIFPQKCPICPKEFLTNAKRLQHVRKAHPRTENQIENESVL